MKQILIKTVNVGTGIGAKLPGLEIRRKNGTAHIAKGKYVNSYHTSVRRLRERQKRQYDRDHRHRTAYVTYFASITAVPVFKAIVDVMVEEKCSFPIRSVAAAEAPPPRLPPPRPKRAPRQSVNASRFSAPLDQRGRFFLKGVVFADSPHFDDKLPLSITLRLALTIPIIRSSFSIPADRLRVRRDDFYSPRWGSALIRAYRFYGCPWRSVLCRRRGRR